MRLLSDWPAPTDYLEALADEVAWRQKVDEAAARRAVALHQMHKSGMSYAQIANVIGLSRARVQQLVEKGRR